MTIFQSLILGAVQGLTEFIPVSSSGHLVLVPMIFGWAYQSLTFDLVLHFGTALALIIYFWKDLIGLLKNMSLLKLLIVGSIPAVVLGVLFENAFEFYFRSELWVVLFLLLGSILMFLAEKLFVNRQSVVSNVNDIGLKKAFLVGCFQALALFPGFSRSGSTISGSMLLGLDREQAARFSFLLSLPIVLAAGFFKLLGSYNQLTLDASIVIGFFTSFLVGLFAISFLMKFLKTNKLYVFVMYRVILCVVLLLMII